MAYRMEWTDVHFRQLARLISKHTWLWTEMVVDNTILHNTSLDKYLWFPAEQKPLVLQLGGSNPDTLAGDGRFCVTSQLHDPYHVTCTVAACTAYATIFCFKLAASAACSQTTRISMTVKARLGMPDTLSTTLLHTYVGPGLLT